MRRHQGNRPSLNSDALAVRRAARKVGVQITVASTVVVVAIIARIYFFIISQVTPGELFELVPDLKNLSLSAEQVLRGAVTVGVVLIVLAGLLGWFIARQAVRPLGDALRVQHAFVADASHELRTPLTVLNARLQVLQRGLKEGDPSAATVAQLRNDAQSLIDIVNDLLLTAEVQGSRNYRAAPTPLNPVIIAAVASMQLVADSNAVRITLNASEPVSTLLPATSAQRCLVALLDNALKFAPYGSEIVVTETATNSAVTVKVRDSGPGIQGIDPDRIFDRFAHTTEATGPISTARSGSGIGLALVRDIATRNGGSVAVVKSSADGTEISFSVPRARERHQRVAS